MQRYENYSKRQKDIFKISNIEKSAIKFSLFQKIFVPLQAK